MDRKNSRGFTLIAALLLTILLSGVAVGLLFMVTNEARMGGNDLEGNLAYYGAEAGIENLTSEISQLYQTSQAPTAAAITALTDPSTFPTMVTGANISHMNYVETITWPTKQSNGLACPNLPNPCGSWDIVGAGSNQGMVATLIPFTLQVTATRAAGSGQTSTDTAAATGASVNLTRTVEVALLPAFEFGIFCDGDCDYFAGPNFNFGGRVHTNGNLFLASGAKLTFTDKVAAVGQVVLDRLENGHSTSSGYTGNIYLPNASGGCPAAPGTGPAANCIALTQGSWTGGFPPSGTPNYNPGPWTGISKSTFNAFIENGYTGATKLQLPFVNSSKVGAIDIIRKPTPVDSQLLASARLYNEASIRILLADTQADLYPGETRTDSASQDIQIGYPFTNLSTGTSGYVTVAATSVTSGGNMYLGMAVPKSASNDWAAAAPTGCLSSTIASWPNWPLFGQVTVSGKQCQGAWLRVEYQNAGGQWIGVTTQWLSYGFSRNYNQPPTHPYNVSTATAPKCNNFPSYPTAQCQNSISPAILILQQLQSAKTAANAYGTSTTANYWLPLNFYDAREGEPRDTRPGGDPQTMCSPNGIMNAVELDVGNLWLWLQASGPYSGGSGKLVNASTYNGYILYFADHRGMLTDQYPLTTFYNGLSGMSGLNDVVNSTSSTGVPDTALEPITYYASAPNPFSPEDTAVKGSAVNHGHVDNWGQTYLGAGFGINAANMRLPYYIYGSVTASAVQCYAGSVTKTGSAITGFTPTYNVSTAEWNMVTGPRHALRLIDAGMDSSGNSFVPPTHGTLAANGNGFTVASEEPVYVWGDYNTGSSDPFWPSENTLTTPHSAAAIIADSVTLLSNPPSNSTTPTIKLGWTDIESFVYPATMGNRPANNSYYRMAIAAGKSIPFPQPSWGGQDFGTDGGMHNFLRYLEDRSNGTVNYAGSMISMYYSQYDTGNFKCCNSVYGAPTRNYFFDTLFQDPNNLPPGTPSFQDVVSLSYHQSFTPQ
ncbi:MAG TPA: PilX N-terminal domain-containing pilus assembly protein [Candidatus Sulfotelmatobacter sp.]|nr:PilX N-terminal domain-containing pilus assembly protein [Candidatus Sulfotelmatobacter sp.]